MNKLTEAKKQKYMSMALHFANEFSKDKSTKVGCIFLDPNTLFILTSSYNGLPFNIEELDQRWERPTKYKYVCHAEMNAVCAAARNGTCLSGCIAVITLFPCSTCTKMLIQAGISAIITKEPDFLNDRWGDDFKVSYEMLAEAGIHVSYI